MHHVLRLGPVPLSIPFGFLFGFGFILFGFLFGVACVGSSEERDLSHDAGSDRSSRLAKARTFGTESTSHGSSRTSGDHKATSGGHEAASGGHEAASAGPGVAATGHEAASAAHGTTATEHETASVGGHDSASAGAHDSASAVHETAGDHAVVGESAHAADESADSHGEELSQSDSSQEDSNHGGPPHWVYGGGPGQRLWGELSAEFTACVDGSAQSPINLANAIPAPLRNIDFKYQLNKVG